MASHGTIDLADLLPATFTAPDLSDEQFLALCEKFPDAMLEYTEDGEVIVMPPTDPLSSARVALVTHRLSAWAERSRRGTVSGPDGGFRFPSTPADLRMQPGSKGILVRRAAFRSSRRNS